MFSKILNFFKNLFTPKVPKREKVELKTREDRDPQVLEMAFSLLGESEIPGSKHNPRIIEMHSYTTLKAKTDEVPWCSSFVNFCMESSGVKGTGSAAARSWMNWGIKTDSPKRGDIVVIKRGSSSWQGHVFFYLKEDDKYIYGLGGNQNNMVSIDKFPKSKLLGYRTYRRPCSRFSAY